LRPLLSFRKTTLPILSAPGVKICMIVIMAERYTSALVLNRENKNHQDILFTLYTKDLGKIRAIAKSARKITSKLTGHLTQGRVVDIRIIDKGSFQLLDSLSSGDRCTNREVLKLLHFLESMTPYNQPDLHVWHIAKEVVNRCEMGPVVYGELLRVMGFAPSSTSAFPTCARCREKRSRATLFYVPELVFLCSNCGTDVKIDEDDLVEVV
jgi:recombinational DNA repair protein (RecF pathway)